MITTQQHILAVLRDLHMRFYLQTLSGLARDRADYEEQRDAIANVSGDAALFVYPALTDLLKTPEYRAFIEELSNWEGDAALVAQTLLERREYEERLAFVRRERPDEYLGELRVIEPDELVTALTRGVIVNATDEYGDPLRIPADESVSGAFVHDPVPTARVDADVIRAVLVAAASGQITPDPSGLRLRQVAIIGTLDLNWLTLEFPLGFQGCELRDWMWADNFTAPELTFDTCDFTPADRSSSRGAINAARIRIERKLRFWDCRGFAQLFLPGAQIGIFSLRTPHHADAAHHALRTVLDGAEIGTLFVPTDADDIGDYTVPGGIRIGSIDGSVADITHWLEHMRVDAGSEADATPGAPARVWEECAAALERDGRAVDAKDLRINWRRHLRRQRWFLPRFFSWLTLDVTVRYLHRPQRAIWWFLGVLVATWALAFAFHGELMKSPLASEPVPASWLQELLSAAGWSFVYALDLTIAPLSLGQIQTMWPASVWLVLALAVLKGAGILLLGLFLASVTNLVSKSAG